MLYASFIIHLFFYVYTILLIVAICLSWFPDWQELWIVRAIRTVTDPYLGYVFITVIANIGYFVSGIIGAIKARKGQFYYIIFFGKLAFHRVFLVREAAEKIVVNRPPSL